MTQQVAL